MNRQSQQAEVIDKPLPCVNRKDHSLQLTICANQQRQPVLPISSVNKRLYLAKHRMRRVSGGWRECELQPASEWIPVVRP